MARWEAGAQGRIEQAALDLFAEHGYDRTTVAEIAERAGLTKRTFFRHFADKREVLFAGQVVLSELYRSTIAEAPAGLEPMAVMSRALHAVADMMQGRRTLIRHRQAVIAANPELQERELLKRAQLADEVAAALEARGVTAPSAALLAEVALAAFHVGFVRWVGTRGRGDFASVISDVLEELSGTVGDLVRP